MAVEDDGNFHWDTAFGAMKNVCEFARHSRRSSSEACGYPRKIGHAGSICAMLHPVKRAVGCGKQLFRRIAVFRKGSNAGTDRKRGRLGFPGEALAYARNDAVGDFLPGFREHERKLVSAVARRRI